VTLIARTHTYCTYYSVSCIRYVLYDRIPCFLPSDPSKSASSDFDCTSSLHSVIDISRVSADPCQSHNDDVVVDDDDVDNEDGRFTQ